jgi:hypothetical protein
VVVGTGKLIVVGVVLAGLVVDMVVEALWPSS